MAQNQKKWVAFRTNATVPASVIGGERNQKMQVGQPVQLPASYADHVVHEGFATFCDAPKKTASKKSDAAQSSDNKAAAKLEAAQSRVDDLNAKMENISEGDDGWEDLTKELDEAVTELAALQPAS